MVKEAGMPRGSSPKRERQYEHIKDSGRSNMTKAQLERALAR
jgi:hypothetical protein